MKEIIQLISTLPIEHLLKAIEEKPFLFDEITARQDTPGSYHQDTETIFLRWAKDRSAHAAFTEIEAIDYPALFDLSPATSLILEALKYIGVGASALGRVIIVQFHPKGFIAPHIDEGAYADHYERFHLILASEPGNHFMVETKEGEGEFVHMKPGSLYWFNHKKKHSVVNFSEKPRLHMIIDAVAPKYRRERDV